MLYNIILALRLKGYYREHEHQMSQHATLDALTEAWTISHFDKTVVCKVFGCVSSLQNPRLELVSFPLPDHRQGRVSLYLLSAFQ